MTPIVPSASTCTAGVKAATAGSGFTRTGADQVSPPSGGARIGDRIARAAEKRESCHATCSDAPGPGRRRRDDRAVADRGPGLRVAGADAEVLRDAHRRGPGRAAVRRAQGDDGGRARGAARRVIDAQRHVHERAGGGNDDHVADGLARRARVEDGARGLPGGAAVARCGRTSRGRLPCRAGGPRPRTRSARPTGSAVIVFLSLKYGAVSATSGTAAPQVSPPSPDRETSIALAEPGANEPPVVESDIAHAVPSGPIETHGSVARSKSPPFAAVPPPQREKAIGRTCPGGAAVEGDGGHQPARGPVGPAVLLPQGDEVIGVGRVRREARLHFRIHIGDSGAARTGRGERRGPRHEPTAGAASAHA